MSEASGPTGGKRSGSRAGGIFLFLFALCAGLAMYLYRVDVWITVMLVMLASMFLGLVCFTIIVGVPGLDQGDTELPPSEGGTMDPQC